MACVSVSRSRQKICKYFLAMGHQDAKVLFLGAATLWSGYLPTIKCVATLTGVGSNTVECLTKYLNLTKYLVVN